MKLNKLKKGDKVSLIAPAGAVFDISYIDKSISKLNDFGYNVKLGKHVYSKFGYLAGNDNERLEDIHEAFLDKDVKAIFCIRGGYGTIRLLSNIDYNIIKNNPKIFVGYSDITAIHAAFSNLNIPTFHGPMFNLDLNKNLNNYNDMFEFIEGNNEVLEYNLVSMRNGNMEGEIVGGNLTVLCSLLGSKYIYNFEDKILFIEEINEEPYKIDRFFYQLYLSGVLNKIKGIILGDFTNCYPEDKNKSFQLQEVIESLLKLTDKPIYKGLQCGHGYINKILPIGVKVVIKSSKLIIRKGDVFND